MILVPRADWPAWIVSNYGDSLAGPVLIGVPDEPADREPGVFFMVRRMFFNARISRMNEDCVPAYWCYESAAEAVLAFLPWNGKGHPNDRWLKHGNATTGEYLRRRRLDGKIVPADDEDEAASG